MMSKNLMHELGHTAIAILFNERPRRIDMSKKDAVFTTYFDTFKNKSNELLVMSGGIAIEYILFKKPRYIACVLDYKKCTQLLRDLQNANEHTIIIQELIKILYPVIPLLKIFERVHRYNTMITYTQLKFLTGYLERYRNAIPPGYGCKITKPNKSPSI